MKVKLDDTHVLNSDSYCCWISTIYESKKGKPYEKRTSGYCSTLEDAIETYINKRLLNSDADTAKKLLKEIKDIKREVRGWKSK